MTGEGTATDVAAATADLWENVRLVVVDTETTGLSDTARVVSFAAYTLSNGTTTSSWSTLVNPGVAVVGAADIHGLTAQKLANAPAFSEIAPQIRRTLTSSGGETVMLVGHNVNFDYRRLDYEFFLLDDDLGSVRLLDTKRLARAAGVASANLSLEQLGAKFGLANPAAHEANADALLTREIVFRSIRLLAEQGATDLRLFATDAYRGRYTDEPETVLSDEHALFHAADMLDPASRDTALDGCLGLSCAKLDRRVEDCVVDAATARRLAGWVTETLEQQGLSRFQRGLLAAAYVRVLRTWRELLVRPSAATFTNRAVAFCEQFAPWKRCDDPDDLCDTCGNGKADQCRFATTPTRLVFVCLYNNDGEITGQTSVRYCYGTNRTPATPLDSTSGYAKFATTCPDAALTGAVAAVRAIRSTGHHPTAMAVAQALWTAGVCSAGLTNLYAALVEDTGRNDPLTLLEATGICLDGSLRGGAGDWDSVKARETRLLRRIAQQEKPPPKEPRNVREGRRVRFT